MLDRLAYYLDHGAGSDFWFQRSGQPLTKRPGFFRAQVINKRWWLVDPQNQPWLSMGISVIRHKPSPGYPKASEPAYFEAVAHRYGDGEAWARAQALRMRTWGFNTVGAWSSDEMLHQGLPYTILMEVSQYAGVTAVDRHHGEFMDVFSDEFHRAVEQSVSERCLPYKDDPLLVGYFTDNELDWEQKYRSSTMFDYFLAKPSSAPAKQALVTQLRERYAGNIGNFNQVWDANIASFDELRGRTAIEPGLHAQAQLVAADKEAFIRLVARAYFETCERDIRSADPHHMVLGCRFAGRATPAVYEECGKYCDVISYNNYSYDAPVQHMQPIFDASLRPIMITEFSFKAMDSGLPNTKGAAIAVYAQEDRADGYERYVTGALSLPYVVGLHWFMHHDQPPSGADDRGENSNYGVVDVDDEPYCTLVERMRLVNGRAVEIAKAAPPLPGRSDATM